MRGPNSSGIGTSAIPVIGPLIGVIIAIVEVFMERDDYRSWLDSVGCAVGTSLSQIMQVRQTLKAINTTQMMLSGTVYEQAAGLLHRFSYSSNAGNFSDYSATLESYGQKEQRLAEAIDDAIPALDNLVKDFLYWNGPSGTVIGHIEGYESTFANWTDSYNSVFSNLSGWNELFFNISFQEG